MELHVEFVGGKGRSYRAAFDQIAMAGGRQTSVKVLRAGAEPIRQMASELCRRGEEGPPHLADNIRILWVDKKTKNDEPAIGIGAPKEFFYDYWLEYGTRHAQAFPFYRPALDSQAPAAVMAISQGYWEDITGRL